MDGIKGLNEMKEREISGRKCFIYDRGSSDVFLIEPIGSHSLEMIDAEVDLIEELSGGKGFTAVMILTDWNQDLPPWAAEPVMRGDDAFGSGAPDTLQFITEQLIPELATGGEQKVYLGGYSLAGLFALWAAYQTDLFDGVAAASPSVWYPDWPAFAEANEVQVSRVYLSLGKKEEKTRHPLMRTVGDNIRKQHDLLSASHKCREVILEMNPGNHFVAADLRMAKGFAWLMAGEE